MKSALTRRWSFRFAALALIFGLAGVAQHWFVHWQIYRQTDQQLAASAAALIREAAPNGVWDLQELRQTFLNVPGWYVITRDSLLLDAEDTVPALFPRVSLVGGQLPVLPHTIISSVGEQWRLLGKPLDSGVAIVGISSVRDTIESDSRLKVNLDRIPHSLRDAASVRSSAIDVDVDWAVVSSNGELVRGLGGIPLIVDSRSFPRSITSATSTTYSIDSQTYRLHNAPVFDATGRAIGAVILPMEISPQLRTLAVLDRFNAGITIALLAITGAWGIRFASQEWPHESAPVSIQSAIQNGESKTLEFKASYQWDIWRHGRNPELRLNVLRAVAGFLNAEGGTLIIGIAEEKTGIVVSGIREDLDLLGGSQDKLRLALADLISTQIGHEFSRLITDHIDQSEGRFYWSVRVRPSRKLPAFVIWKGREYFFVREGPKTNELGPKTAQSYINDHWG